MYWLQHCQLLGGESNLHLQYSCSQWTLEEVGSSLEVEAGGWSTEEMVRWGVEEVMLLVEEGR